MLRLSTTAMENNLTRKIKTREAAVKVIKKFFDDIIIDIYNNYNEDKRYKLLAAERTVKSKYETVAEISKEILELIDEENFESEYEKNTEFDLYYHEKHIELAKFIKEKELKENEDTVTSVGKSNVFKWSNIDSNKYSSVLAAERSNNLEYETVNELTSNELSNEILELFDAGSMENDYEKKNDFDLFYKKKCLKLPKVKKKNSELTLCYKEMEESATKYDQKKEIDAYYMTRNDRATKYPTDAELDACYKKKKESVNEYKTNTEVDGYYNEHNGTTKTHETNEFDINYNEQNKSGENQEDNKESDAYHDKQNEAEGNKETKTEFEALYNENSEVANDYDKNIEIDPYAEKKIETARKNKMDSIEPHAYYDSEKHMEFAKFFKDIDFKDDNSTQRFSKSNVMIMPNMNIRTFNGDPTQWKSFVDSFECEIDNNEDISNAEKMNYLINNLSGESESFIKGLNLCKENYQMAFQLLKERYDDNFNKYK